MTPLVSTMGPRDPEFQEHRDAMLELVAEVRELEARVRAHGAKSEPRFEKRGQLPPRQRVERLLDPGSDFVELSTLAGLRMHDDDGHRTISGGGNIIGIGEVSGVRCLVTASDSAIKGGSVTPMGLRKTLRAQKIAMEQRLPIINLVESGGPTCCTKPRSSWMAGGCSRTWPARRPWACRRSPSSMGHRPPGGPISRGSRTM